jgi:hypothetical protein
MKISVDIECSPEEARAFLGLPNVAPVNDMIVESMLQRTRDNIDSLSDPKVFWERALVASGQSMEMMQALFGAAAQGSSSKKG